MAASGLYCTLNDIALSYPVPLGASTRPATGQVASLISAMSAELEAAAAYAGYAVPIPTGATQAMAQLQEYTVRGVLWRCLRITYPSLGGPADHNIGIGEYRDAYNTALTEIRDGQLPLIGAPLDQTDTDRLLPRSWNTSHGQNPLAIDDRDTWDPTGAEDRTYGPAIRRGWQP